MTQSKISLTATLVVHDLERYALTQIVKAFSQASDILRSVSAKHRVTHQVALHALAYKRLSSLKNEERDPSLSEPLPSQYAHRAIQRLTSEWLGVIDSHYTCWLIWKARMVVGHVTSITSSTKAYSNPGPGAGCLPPQGEPIQARF